MGILRGKFLNGLALAFFSAVASVGALADDYPRTPDATLTPGTLCSNPDSHRYPEQIPYCNRAVSSSTKREVMEDYDRELGYRTTELPRSQFKIDHYIPLCMGGGNEKANLWPQHVTIGVLTDRCEPLLCREMEEGRMTQAEAVDKIKEVKANPETGPTVADDLERANPLTEFFASRYSLERRYKLVGKRVVAIASAFKKASACEASVLRH